MDAVTLESAVKEYQARREKAQLPSLEPERSPQLSERLWRRFGGGQRPELRRALYARVERVCTAHGVNAEQLVREACEGAKHALQPGNYFAATIIRKFREAGLLGEAP